MEKMTATTPRSVPDDAQAPESAQRMVIYATSRLRGKTDDYITLALRALRPLASCLIVVACGDLDDSTRLHLEDLCDEVVADGGDFTPGLYKRILDEHADVLADLDEVVLTGDSWFGPVHDLTQVVDRMQGEGVDFWEMIENRAGAPRAFPEQGFPGRLEPWTWTVVRRRLFTSRAWHDYWVSGDSGRQALEQESRFAAHFHSRGFSGTAAFASHDFGNDDPGTLSPDLLVQAGCPIVKRMPFTLYPPYLHQQAVIGRDIVATIGASGYPLSALWQHLARTVQPKALNTIAGMLEVPVGPADRAESPALKIVVVAHVSDVDQAPELFRRLASLPPGYDLVVTTPDGRKAVTLSGMLDKLGPGAGSVDVRVTPANRGRDMADLFIACRDVLIPGRYDLVVKVHARRSRRKTMNVRRYFRRYQLDNLLGSPDHVAGILNLFDREPGLGLVFPPMMHIGYATMGRAWGAYREPAQKLFAELGIGVPVDRISPLAPFGGMWFARPEALRLLAQQRWLYRDYAKPGRQRYRDLARLQERAVTYAAAELGFHSRTVLTPEHAAISHTAIEFKADQLFSTTRGYPVDSILLIQRAGNTGYGGLVGLSRMYLRINHRILSRILLPPLAGAQWVYSSVRALMGDERFIRERETWRDEDL